MVAEVVVGDPAGDGHDGADGAAALAAAAGAQARVGEVVERLADERHARAR